MHSHPHGKSQRSQDDFPGSSEPVFQAPVSSKYFEIEQDDLRTVPKLSLMFRDGRRVFIPYSHQPVIDLQPGEGLKIAAHNIAVTIMGRGLGKIMDYFYDDRIRWIRESNSVMDDGAEEVFIASIVVETF